MISPQAEGLPGSMVWLIPDRSSSGRVWRFLRSAPAEQAPRIPFRVARESRLPGTAAREEGQCKCGGFGSGLLLLKLRLNLEPFAHPAILHCLLLIGGHFSPQITPGIT